MTSEEIGGDLGEREAFWGKNRPGTREREICRKSNLKKYREFFPSSLTLPGKGSDLGKDRRTSWEDGEMLWVSKREGEGKREKIRESKI